ncbi:MAG: formylmethanofuran dehydrogenase [Candidatus Syntrophonatronum acetioxidans]|uniref:Formylmethanofuran dehydrogenase n=1 Tax=Candidatus Syntrophonatronum acetioxidans TaxID=1795816 RepID=A0A424YC49_9FIRM|nr:MAG: formylmethanofuran dehydrogenase [Candidatus Syntrophonatronum acetioxidans]
MCMELTPWERSVQFHGHTCPGLAIGFRVAQLALKEIFKEDIPVEKRWAQVDSGSCACGVDAIQLLVGCSTGKGNLVVNDWGKEVYTFGVSGKTEALRIVVKEKAWPSGEFWETRKRVMSGEGGEEERENFLKMRDKASQTVLDLPKEDLYTYRWIEKGFPAKNLEFKLVDCQSCGEPVQEKKLQEIEGKKICGSCLENM